MGYWRAGGQSRYICGILLGAEHNAYENEERPGGLWSQDQQTQLQDQGSCCREAAGGWIGQGRQVDIAD